MQIHLNLFFNIKMINKISWFNYLALFTIILIIQTVSSQPAKNISNFEDVDTNLSNKKLIRTKRDSVFSNINFQKVVGLVVASFMCHSPLPDRTYTEREPKKETCKINVKQLDPAHALIINPSDHTKFLYPDDNGDIVFMQGESVHLSCADLTNYFPLIPYVRHETFICICDHVFFGRGDKYNFENLRCEHPPKHTIVDKCEIADDSSRSNGVHYRKYEIGFFTDDDKNFLKTMDIVYNDSSSTTMYSKSMISKALAGGQTVATNVPFDPSYCCNKENMNMDEIYDPQTQLNSFELQLGIESAVPVNERYVRKGTDYIFTRGQLTPPSSMVYTAAGASTFAYLNVVPEWQIIKQGNWIHIENHINEMAKVLKKDLTVITGVTYPMKLEDKTKPDIINDGGEYLDDSDYTEMFFYATRPNDVTIVKKYPIPSFLFKIVIEPESNDGVVFVTMHNPHATYVQLLGTLCFVARSEVPGVAMPKGWQPDNRDWGTSYICEVQDFLHLTKITLFEHIAVRNLLYIPDLAGGLTTLPPSSTTRKRRQPILVTAPPMRLPPLLENYANAWNSVGNGLFILVDTLEGGH